MARPTQEEIMRELGAAGIGGLGVSPVGGNTGCMSADDLGNDPTMEGMWAMKAMEHADIHFNILCAVDPTILKLTPKDDKIYDEFRKEFPNFKIDKIVEEELKSPAAKEKWRPFCQSFEKEVEDYSMATLLRLDSSDEYSESNTILVTRIQFLAIEIARNREGANDTVKKNFKPTPKQKK